MGIRTCYLCQQAGHTSKECPRKNVDTQTDSSKTMEIPNKPDNFTKNKKQKQTHINPENTQKNITIPITTPVNDKTSINTNNKHSQESIDVESLTNSQIQEINAIQADLSQQTSTTVSNPTETLDEDVDTEEEDDGDYCSDDDKMSTESEDSQIGNTNDEISDEEIQDIENNKTMNYPSLPSSYDSTHAEAQRKYIYETRSQSSQNTTSTVTHNKLSIPDSQPSETDHDMML
jgi:hypothetical protein